MLGTAQVRLRVVLHSSTVFSVHGGAGRELTAGPYSVILGVTVPENIEVECCLEGRIGEVPCRWPVQESGTGREQKRALHDSPSAMAVALSAGVQIVCKIKISLPWLAAREEHEQEATARQARVCRVTESL